MEKVDNPYVLKELQDLTEIAKTHQVYNEQDIQSLKEVNSKLWNIEDQLRELEKQQYFSSTFIELARQVYITNDQRALYVQHFGNSSECSERESEHEATSP